MKKLIKLFVFVLVLTMCVSSLTGCLMMSSMNNLNAIENNAGNANNEEPETTENDTATDNEVEEVEKEVTPEDIEKVAEYVEKYKDEYRKTDENGTIIGELSARETSIVYTYTFTEDVSDKTIEGFEAALNSRAYFQNMGSYLEVAKSEETAVRSIIMEFVDIYGNVVVSKEYK